MHNGPNRAPCPNRNKVKCERYRREHRREKSHVRRLEKHMKRYHDSSPMVRNALEKYKGLMRIC